MGTEGKPRLRKHARLHGFDYARPGAYFVTVVTRHRLPLLEGRMREEVLAELRGVSERYPGVAVGTHVVMPNHLHLILWLKEGSPRLSQVLRAFKSLTTRRYRDLGGRGRLWQVNYFEHVIRTERALGRIEGYILQNPHAVELDIPSFYRPLGEDANK